MTTFLGEICQFGNLTFCDLALIWPSLRVKKYFGRYNECHHLLQWPIWPRKLLSHYSNVTLDYRDLFYLTLTFAKYELFTHTVCTVPIPLGVLWPSLGQFKLNAASLGPQIWKLHFDL